MQLNCYTSCACALDDTELVWQCLLRPYCTCVLNCNGGSTHCFHMQINLFYISIFNEYQVRCQSCNASEVSSCTAQILMIYPQALHSLRHHAYIQATSLIICGSSVASLQSLICNTNYYILPVSNNY